MENVLDFIAAALLIFALFFGAKRGLVLSLGGLAVTVVAFVIARWAVNLFGAQAEIAGSVSETVGNFIGAGIRNVLVFYITFVLVQVLGRFLLKLADGICGLPILRTANRLGGAICGVLSGAILMLIAGQILVLTGLLPAGNELNGSCFARYFLWKFL